MREALGGFLCGATEVRETLAASPEPSGGKYTGDPGESQPGLGRGTSLGTKPREEYAAKPAPVGDRPAPIGGPTPPNGGGHGQAV